MIKIGCNFLSLKGPNRDVDQFIKMSYDLRLDIIDWHTSAFPTKNTDDWLKIKRRCLDWGLSIGYLGIGGSFMRPNEPPSKQVERCKAGIDMAAFLGCPMIRTFGAPKDVNAKDGNDAIFEGLAKGLREAADCGADKGVMVALQNHNHGNIASTGKDVIRILETTNHANVTLIMDTGQWAGSIGDEGHPDLYDPNTPVYDYMEQTIPYSGYIRAKFYKCASGHEEHIDYKRVAKILKKANFNGSVSIVYEGQEETDRAIIVKNAANELREVLRAEKVGL
ncbi:MAG: sugar phosphate isomerase/epimerase [SAR202 cluster bacterium]|nr:sugar phosphate isomerase/epimerase [SAR202 cluster bacterium]